jgi:hypothetical protein
MAVDKYKVPASMLAPAVDPEQLGFKDTSELTPLSETIGQERAVGALEFGLQMTSPGFNIFVSGPVGRPVCAGRSAAPGHGTGRS